MKLLTIIIIIATTLSAVSGKGTNEKFYQVTNNGKFHFSYWNESGKNNPKLGTKPVTMRTFYLETLRFGLLPKGMTYNEFVKLSTEEKQALINASQYEIIAAIEAKEDIDINPTPSVESQINEEIAEDVPLSEEQNVKRVTLDIDAPWVVKAITNPGAEHEMPTDTFEIEVKDTKLPWIVDAVVNHGEQSNEAAKAKVQQLAKKLNASK